MQDANDTVTIDLPLRARRGRPSTGEAKTPAQRKADQRRRDRHEISFAFDDSEKFASMPTGTLCEALSVYVTKGYAGLVGLIISELARRAVEHIHNKESAYTVNVTVTID